MSIYKKMRLDRILVDRGLAVTRSRAADLIRLGAVSVDGQPALKPGALIEPGARLIVDGQASPFVSRGGLKLAAALDAFGLNPKGLVALDIGASTGGFTEVLLQRGATCVYAVDVGRDQLHAKLRDDPRVVALEATDARALGTEVIEGPVGAIVADVSFISLTKALPAALNLAAPGAWLVALVKPQFEVGRKAVGKGGIVRDAQARARAVAEVRAFIDSAPGWKVFAEMPSPIPGGSGNEEVLIGASHGA
ncbi:TlyA family RNA methyltransferase [Methyloceanibacter sp.]|uniref:TlyA family RNA methyltransferase n=1 Tax=Methyloceanibacter sp. TaxID=1965321 RepID=UPI003D6CA5C8